MRKIWAWGATLAIAFSVLVPATLTTTAASAATPKFGAACSPKGKTTATLQCAKVGTKLVWLKRQKLTFNAPTAIVGGPSETPITIKFNSGLTPRIDVGTPVCKVTATAITRIKTGTCNFAIRQAGNKTWAPFTAKLVNIPISATTISFDTVAQVPLSSLSLKLTAAASNDASVEYVSLTPLTCSVTGSTLNLLALGDCQVKAYLSGDAAGQLAEPVIRTIEIVAGRTTIDQPDTIAGFQIKPVYVVPSDGLDRNWDTNGQISSFLDEGNGFLQDQMGLSFQVDSTAGGYDIAFMRSKYTKAQIMDMAGNTVNALAQEFAAMDNPGSNRKDYVFFTEVPYFKGGEACGIANIDGMNAVVAMGDEGTPNGGSCANRSLVFDNYISLTWIHEVFHNLGVEHTTDDNCDMMRGMGNCYTKWTIDSTRTRYLGSAAQGANVLTLRVWKGHTQDTNLRASCILAYEETTRTDGLNYVYCPTGIQAIGALSYCWSAIRSDELQEWQGSGWVSLGSGNSFNAPWGQYVDWTCDNSSYTAPWKEITRTTPGVVKYRWMVNGKESEQLVVIWVN